MNARMIKSFTIAFLAVFTCTALALAGTVNLPRTGQTASYYSRDDGDLEKGVAWPSPRFHDNGNGTVTDNLTGLMYTKNTNLAGTYMTWQQALDFVKTVITGGHTDWRLPNKKELRSLIDYSQYNPALPLGHPFTNVQSYLYWSSTTVAGYPDGAWVVDIGYGGVYSYDKSYDSFYGGYAWPVRGGHGGSFGDSNQLKIISPLIISPQKDTYYVGDSLTASFTVQNVGTAPITMDVLTVGGRLNGWCTIDGCPDFTYYPVTIQSNETYQYQGYFTVTKPGSYIFFIAYHIANPTSDEKKLLDENNWNTNVPLGEGLTNSDKIKNITVISQPDSNPDLEKKIKDQLNKKIIYPPYLLDPNAFDTAVAIAWDSLTG